MKTMILALTSAACLLVGCMRLESGPELTERATVADLPYVPAGHGSGMGLSMKGDLSVSSVDIPARYAVVFECQHGRFVVEREDLWRRLHVGQAVTIRYRELYKVDDNGRHLYALDFLGAQ